jgi:tripartite motif-containing protein 71
LIYAAEHIRHTLCVFESNGKPLPPFQLGEKPNPVGIAFNPWNGNMAVVEEANNRVLLLDPKGQVLQTIEELTHPSAVTFDQSGNLVITDPGTATVRVITQNGNLLKTVTTPLTNPTNVCVDREGNFIIVDNYNVKLFDPSGKFIRQIGSAGAFVAGIAVDFDGNVILADMKANNVQIYNQQGKLLTSFGSGGELDEQFGRPIAVAIDREGNILVSDPENDRVAVWG